MASPPREHRAPPWSLLGPLLLASCAGVSIDAGTNDVLTLRDAGSAGETGAPSDAAKAACPNAGPSDIAGGWRGYVENLSSPLASDALVLAFSASRDQSLCGTVTFGELIEEKALPSPDIGYPANFPVPKGLLRDAFPFTILDGVATGNVITFALWAREPWRAWCEQQDPRRRSRPCPTGDLIRAERGCFVRNGDKAEPIDCRELGYCDIKSVCDCTSEECVALPDKSLKLELDLGRDDPQGTLTAESTPREVRRVYLWRAD